MPLEDDQRAWLDQALRTKGRFTRAASIRKEFENYQRRREKAAVAWAGIPANHPDYQTIQNGINAADEAASNGKFSNAYKQLASVKTLAKAAVEGRSEGIYDANLRMSLKVLEGQVNVTTTQVDGCFQRDAAIKRRIAALPEAGSATDFEGGLGILRTIDKDLAPALRGDVAEMIKDYITAAGEVQARDVGGTITRLETDLAALRATGRGDIADKYSGGLDTLARVYRGSGGRYTNTGALTARAGDLSLELERALKAARDLGAIAPDPQAESVRPDDQTAAIRAGLTPVPQDVRAQMELAEQERADARVQEYFRQRNADSFALLDTSTGLVAVAEMPEQYEFDTVFAGMFPPNDTIPDDVPDDLRDDMTASAVQRIAAAMTDDDVSDDVLLNMSVRCAEDFKAMAVEQLFPGKEAKDLTRSQRQFTAHMAAEMEREVIANAPNKMADDASEITVGGVRYELLKVLKSGGNGTARLYRDPNPPNETVVVKSMNDEARRADMAYEIETHYRATKAADEDSSIVEFKGAARSDDGSVHLVMEAVAGGDLEDMNAGLAAMESLGVLPPEAKAAIAVENLRKVVEAMKELEAQGLVNHDLKPENVMFTADGKVKIIDYGEAAFVEDDGVARPGRPLGTSPGYGAPEHDSSDNFTEKFDTYALAGFLQKLVGGKSPAIEEIEMAPVSAMGRLIEKMRDPDPSKRPSLDAILATTIMTSAEEDHGPEAMENLTAASADFAGLITGLSLDMDQQTLAEGVGRLNAPFFGGVSPKLSKAQEVKAYIESDIADMSRQCAEDPDFAMREGRDQLKKLEAQVKFVQQQLIDKMVGDQLAKGETEYDEAMKSTEKSVGFSLGDGYREVTPKDAHTLIERLQASIETLRGQAFRLIEQEDLSEKQITEQLDPINQKLADQAIYVERIEAALKAALGSAAKLFLAKKRLNEATVNFRGGKRAAQEVDAGGEIPVDPTDALDEKERFKQGMETISRKRDLAEEIDEEAAT